VSHFATIFNNCVPLAILEGPRRRVRRGGALGPLTLSLPSPVVNMNFFCDFFSCQGTQIGGNGALGPLTKSPPIKSCSKYSSKYTVNIVVKYRE
jgi:hypothetical protein